MYTQTSKKETQAFLGVVGFEECIFWSLVNLLYQVTRKKNDFTWDPEQQQVFEQIKQETVHAIAIRPVWARQDVKNMLYTTVKENCLT